MSNLAKICKNGHVSVMVLGGFGRPDTEPSKFCRDCGALLISECEKCNTQIDGGYHHDIDVIPKFCNICGAAYPWTEKRIQRISDAVGSSDVDAAQKESIMKDLQKLKKSELDEDGQKTLTDKMKTAGKGIWDFAKPIIKDLITEAAKKHAGL